MRSLIGSLVVVLCSVVAAAGCGDSGSSSTTGGSDTGAGGSGGEAIGGNGGNGGAGATGPVGGNGGSGGGVVAPADWTCPAEYYDELSNGVEQAICDCGCGVVDPDCDDTTLPLFDVETACAEGQTCSPTFDGCVGTPTTWMCDDTEFDGGAGNGCDCNCGAADPDCALEPAEVVEGCAAGDACAADGTCLPAAWTCDDAYYGANDAEDLCDCGCGVADPNCDDALVGTCDFCDNEGSCSTEACPGTINPTDNAVCTVP